MEGFEHLARTSWSRKSSSPRPAPAHGWLTRRPEAGGSRAVLGLVASIGLSIDEMAHTMASITLRFGISLRLKSGPLPGWALTAPDSPCCAAVGLGPRVGGPAVLSLASGKNLRFAAGRAVPRRADGWIPRSSQHRVGKGEHKVLVIGVSQSVHHFKFFSIS